MNVLEIITSLRLRLIDKLYSLTKSGKKIELILKINNFLAVLLIYLSQVLLGSLTRYLNIGIF